MGQGFFTQNFDVFQRYQDALSKHEGEQDLVSLIKTALSAVSFSREEYDALTPYTAERLGDALLNVMGQPIGRENLQRTLYFLGAFIREATLLKGSRMGSEQVVLNHFLQLPESEGDEWDGYGFDYVRYTLPAVLLEQAYSKIRGIESEIERKKKEISGDLGSVEERINGYRSELEKLASEYNFVGLSDAFRRLLDQKNKDKNSFRNALFVMGFIAILILSALLTPIRQVLGLEILDWGPSSASKLVGLVGVELLVLYFFRIALKGYMIARNQVTNLQLRLALCAFIEGYLDFAKKAASSNQGAAISGFESLIFSDLPVDENHVPSTFDGIDHIVGALNLIKRPP